LSQIKLNNRTIAKGEPPFIVAEVGVNHNGDIKNALKMIEIAKDARVDAVKFQTFKADEMVSSVDQKYTYKSQGKEITESMLEMFKRYELSKEDWIKIKKKCDDEKILFLSTPQNRTDLDLLLELGITAIKVGSDDFTNIPLIKDYATTGLPLLLSCGMANQNEIHQSLNAVGTLNGYPTVLLLTTSQYPTPSEDVNLLKLKSLEKMFPDIPLGLSDHTQGVLASSLAVALGATVFEKHFTLDHNMPGPDHWFSEDPTGLREWCNSIKNAHKMMGISVLCPTKTEEQNKNEFRRFIVATNNIKRGEVFTIQNIGMRRISQGRGLSPSSFEDVLGKKSTRDYAKGEPIQL
jgi:sialic acid synthase SpsE